MYKSTRPAPAQGLNPERRYSQPVAPSEQQRRGPRTSDVGLTAGSGAGALPGVQEEKPQQLTGDKAGAPPARKTTRVKDGPEMDPDNLNPDGSLRMVHRLPKQQDAFAEANRARYLRRRSPVEWEQSLSVQQIFEK